MVINYTQKVPIGYGMLCLVWPFIHCLIPSVNIVNHPDEPYEPEGSDEIVEDEEMYDPSIPTDPMPQKTSAKLFESTMPKPAVSEPSVSKPASIPASAALVRNNFWTSVLCET